MKNVKRFNEVTGMMQLLDETLHHANHLGGNAMWGGGIRRWIE